MLQRRELIERSFRAPLRHRGMRRTHLRGHTNILKRLLIHAGGFNLGRLLRALLGVGTPRGLQDRGDRAVGAVLDLIHIARELLAVKVIRWCSVSALRPSNRLPSLSPFVVTEIETCATGCLGIADTSLDYHILLSID